MESPAPNWELVHFAASCARCGRDLRGRSDANCPACGLKFDWAEAVPLERLTCQECGYHLCGLHEPRCPECGRAFTWEEALQHYHSRRKPLFENRWRDRPIRSLLRTWWLTLRPWRLWRTIDLHDPPRLIPLATYALLCLFLVLMFAVSIQIASELVPSWQTNRVLSARGRRTWSIWASIWPQTRFVIERQLLPGIGRVLVSWAAFSFLALLVFRQSMRLCRVRTAHVFRVWVYSVVATMPWMAGIFLLGAALSGQGSLLAPKPSAAAFVATVGYATLGLAFGYGWYVRMRHSVFVAVASQVVALLATAIVCVTVVAHPSRTFLEILDWIGIG